jgi:hypothetical protein
MRCLRALSDIASARSLAVIRGHCVQVPIGNCVALVQSQGYVYSHFALLLAEASGQQVLLGADTPFRDRGCCRLHDAFLLAKVMFQVLQVPCACFPSSVLIQFAFRA